MNEVNEINFPYHLITPSIITFLILGLIVYKRKRLFKNEKRRWSWSCITLFFSVYLLIVALALITDIRYQSNLYEFDLNGDGFFNGNEITPEQKIAMKNMISDTGRNFSFISGLFVSGILSITVYTSGLFIKYITKRV